MPMDYDENEAIQLAKIAEDMYKEDLMEILRIGNWTITEEGICWNGKPKVDYMITKERLAETGSGARANTYDWMVHLVEKTWLKREDIYALNTAIVYSLEYFGIGFPEGISFVKTFEEQNKELQRK